MTPYPRRIWPLYSSIPIMMPYHNAHYSKRKGGQVRFTATQTDALEKRFNSNKYLSPEDRRLLADSLKLTDRQVKDKKKTVENIYVKKLGQTTAKILSSISLSFMKY